MLKLNGAAQRSFLFPSVRGDAFSYYADLENVVRFLRYVEIEAQDKQDPRLYRLAYRTQEMGAYDVCVYCDVIYEGDAAQTELQMRPLTAAQSPFAPVEPSVSAEKTVTTGEFRLVSTLREHPQNKTKIDMDLSIVSQIPASGMMKLVMAPLMGVIEPLVTGRMDEVVDHFVQESVAQYRPESL